MCIRDSNCGNDYDYGDGGGGDDTSDNKYDQWVIINFYNGTVNSRMCNGLLCVIHPHIKAVKSGNNLVVSVGNIKTIDNRIEVNSIIR